MAKPVDPSVRARISAAGGRAVPADKRAFSRDRELAARAGAKGGGLGAKIRAENMDKAWHEAWLKRRGLLE